MLDYAGVPHMSNAQFLNRLKDFRGNQVHFPRAILGIRPVRNTARVGVCEYAWEKLINNRFAIHIFYDLREKNDDEVPSRLLRAAITSGCVNPFSCNAVIVAAYPAWNTRLISLRLNTL